MNAEFFALAFIAALNPKLLALDLLLIENRRPRAMFLCLLLGGMTVALTIGLLDVLVFHADAIQHQGTVSAGTDLASPDLLSEGSRQHLQTRRKIRFDHAVEQITARHPAGEEADLLHVAADAPVLSVIVTAYDAAGQPIQVSDLVLPGQRHELRDAYPFT